MANPHFLKNKHFGVLGLGRSGIALSKLLNKLGKEVDAVDTRDAINAELPPEIRVHLNTNIFPDEIEIMAVSPGASPSAELFKNIKLPIVSEVEIAWEASDADVVAITGTDGKTTTTELVNYLLAGSGRRTKACGNIGLPISEVVADGRVYDNLVLEISAFQLWSTHHLKPKVVVFTNIAEDHVDYFDTFEEYVAAKKRLMKNASAEDIGVFNISDSRVLEWGKSFPGKVFTYGLEKPRFGERRMWLERGVIFYQEFYAESDVEIEFLRMKDVKLFGDHNALNIMAALLAVQGSVVGVDVAFTKLGDLVKMFTAPKHRLQKLGSVKGIEVYNDSKATNAHAAMAGIRNLPLGITIIAGGVDKGLDLVSFSKMLVERAANVILIGEVQGRLSAQLKKAGHFHVFLSSSLEDAVVKAFEITDEGGSISLSPACSSFDMFKSYGERGDVFIECVALFR